MVKKIDLNADAGESFGRYELGSSSEVLKYVTSAHIACGFHAGDPIWMKRTVDIAKQYNVDLGAHPGLPDLMGFGRRIMQVNAEETKCYTIYQVGAAKAFMEAAGIRLNHVKPHGAFYVVIYQNEELSRAFLEGMLAVDMKCKLMFLPAPLNYALAKIAEEMGIKVVGEYYPELLYSSDGTMKVWHTPTAYKMRPPDPNWIANEVAKLATEGKITSIDGKDVRFEAQSVCIHGDYIYAPQILQAVRGTLKKAEIDVLPARKILGLC